MALGLSRLFVLTFEVRFFAHLGFAPIAELDLSPEAYAELRSSYDAGVAEFLDLPFVKPNTLGNTRMLEAAVGLVQFGQRGRRLSATRSRASASRASPSSSVRRSFT